MHAISRPLRGSCETTEIPSPAERAFTTGLRAPGERPRLRGHERPLGDPDLDLIEDAWAVEDRYGFSFWDAMIVAAARRLGCATLLTEDLQDGQELGGVVVRSPFTHHP